jgi:hypothetical protein
MARINPTNPNQGNILKKSPILKPWKTTAPKVTKGTGISIAVTKPKTTTAITTPKITAAVATGITMPKIATGTITPIKTVTGTKATGM